MNKQISPKIVSLIFAVLVICFAIAFYTFADWQEPTQLQPGGNVDPLINAGLIDQVKEGGLGVFGAFRAVGGADPDIESGLVVNNGNVGIGTTSPSQKLDVSGQIHATGDICTDQGGGVWLGFVGGGGGLQCTTRTVSGTAAATAVCMESEIITGGGCRPQSGAWVQSAYFSGNSYVCSGLAAGGPNVAVTAYARCCQK